MFDKIIKWVSVIALIFLTFSLLAYAVAFQLRSPLYEHQSFVAGGYAGFGTCAVFCVLPELIRECCKSSNSPHSCGDK